MIYGTLMLCQQQLQDNVFKKHSLYMNKAVTKTLRNMFIVILLYEDSSANRRYTVRVTPPTHICKSRDAE